MLMKNQGKKKTKPQPKKNLLEVFTNYFSSKHMLLLQPITEVFKNHCDQKF